MGLKPLLKTVNLYLVAFVINGKESVTTKVTAKNKAEAIERLKQSCLSIGITDVDIHDVAFAGKVSVRAENDKEE